MPKPLELAMRLPLILAALLLLAGDIIQRTVTGNLWTLALALSRFGFVAIAFLPEALGIPTNRAARAGSLIAFMGFLGTIEARSEDWALTTLHHHSWVSIARLEAVVLLPAGLLIICAVLFRLRAPFTAILLGSAAVLLAIAHALMSSFVLMAGDVLLVVAFAFLLLAAFRPSDRPDELRGAA